VFDHRGLHTNNIGWKNGISSERVLPRADFLNCIQREHIPNTEISYPRNGDEVARGKYVTPPQKYSDDVLRRLRAYKFDCCRG
jgi:hypothetical protein